MNNDVSYAAYLPSVYRGLREMQGLDKAITPELVRFSEAVAQLCLYNLAALCSAEQLASFCKLYGIPADVAAAEALRPMVLARRRICPPFTLADLRAFLSSFYGEERVRLALAGDGTATLYYNPAVVSMEWPFMRGFIESLLPMLCPMEQKAEMAHTVTFSASLSLSQTVCFRCGKGRLGKTPLCAVQTTAFSY